jgi:redox-sensitive bicupin YhaK (pirin superfamily)
LQRVRTQRRWGALRAWKDDEIAPNSGFPLHAHADMEIITYVHEGVITHHDSPGNLGEIRAGDVQVMSAPSGMSPEFRSKRSSTQS